MSPAPGTANPFRSVRGFLLLLSISLSLLLWLAQFVASARRPSLDVHLERRQLELGVLVERQLRQEFSAEQAARLGHLLRLGGERHNLTQLEQTFETGAAAAPAVGRDREAGPGGDGTTHKLEHGLVLEALGHHREALELWHLALAERPAGQGHRDGPGEQSRSRKQDQRQQALLQALIDPETAATVPPPLPHSTLYRSLSCERLALDSGPCANPGTGALTRLLLLGSAAPLTLLAGAVLLLRQLWLLWRRGGGLGYPAIEGVTGTVIDGLLLFFAGFVVLGTLNGLTMSVPVLGLMALLGIQPPLSQGLSTLVLYCAQAAPSLLLLPGLVKPDGSPHGTAQALRQGGGTGPSQAGSARYPVTAASSPAVASEASTTAAASAVACLGLWIQALRWRSGWVAIPQALQGMLVSFPAVALSSLLVRRLFPDAGGSNPMLQLVLDSRHGLALACFAFTAVVLAPLYEELIFRGVLLPLLARRFGVVIGIVSSATLFAAAHLSLTEFVPLFLLGIGLAAVRLSSGRLSSSVLMHACWNGFTFANLVLVGA